MKGLALITMAAALLAFSSAQLPDCSTVCNKICAASNDICSKLPVPAVCTTINAQCTQTCTNVCACFDQCSALCPEPLTGNILLQLFTTPVNLGCQSGCAATCQVRNVITTTASQIAAVNQQIAGVTGQIVSQVQGLLAGPQSQS